MPVTTMTEKYVIDRDRGCGAEVQPPDAFEVSYQGAVLAVRERNFYDDSDFYAVVWDGQTLKSVTYGTTRAWTYPNHAEVDATPEVLEAVRNWLRPQIVGAAIAAERTRHTDPAVLDRAVVVARGRAVPKGTTGEVDQISLSRYDNSDRIRIRLVDGSHVWTAAKNCEVIDPEPVDETKIAVEVDRRFTDSDAGELAHYFVSQSSAIPVL
jgi:hypothetical protein